MRTLVLGGTAWLSGEVARQAVADGHDVTCLARGESGPAPDGARLVRADRDQDGSLDAVLGTDWDLAIDVSRQPGQVRRAAAGLVDRVRHLVFVSTGNVYADHSARGQDESGALLPPLVGDVMETMETYGEAKVACEQAVLHAFGPDRCLLARAGLIGGPGDWSGRTGYWPLRFARPATDDGSVLVPDDPDATSQVVDVRDLAAWLLAAGRGGTSGAYNATGDTVPLTEHLETARRVAGHTGPLLPASPEWLLAHDVQPWMGERSLPLWLGDAAEAGFSARDSSAARAAGLTLRPLEQTLADTLQWELAQDPGRPRRAGLAAAAERELIAALELRT